LENAIAGEAQRADVPAFNSVRDYGDALNEDFD
jgi:hypothetical protein